MDELLEKCQKASNEHDLKLLESLCDEILKKDPKNESALEYKIETLEYLERYEEALKYTDYALKAYPDSFNFYHHKASILLWGLKDIDGAIKILEKGLAMVDDFESHWPAVNNIVDALYEKSDILCKSGDFISAVEANDRILFYREREFKALENIKSITEKHNITYAPTPHYLKAKKLKKQADERAERIDECVDAIEIGDIDDEYVNGLSEFKDYNGLDEYVRDIMICLIASYPYESEKSARFLVKAKMSLIKENYEWGEPACFASIDVGYCCG